MRIVIYGNEWERGGQGMALYVKDAIQALFPSIKVRVEGDPTIAPSVEAAAGRSFTVRRGEGMVDLEVRVPDGVDWPGGVVAVAAEPIEEGDIVNIVDGVATPTKDPEKFDPRSELDKVIQSMTDAPNPPQHADREGSIEGYFRPPLPFKTGA